MKPNEDYVIDQKEAIERVREIDGKISEAFEKSGRRNTEEITRLRFEQMLRGLMITQNPLESGRFY
jgi:hypothetical protein